MLGLVGGLGPAATVHYYRGLVAEAALRGVQLRLLISHADVGRVLDLASRKARHGLAAYLAERCLELEAGGATVLAVGAVTPHLCVDELSRLTSAPGVDLLDGVQAEVRRRAYEKVLVFGTRVVTESRLFGRLEEAVLISDPHRMQKVHDLYVSIVQRGSVDVATAGALGVLAAELAAEENADAVVLAGTELALVPPAAWGDVPVVDCAQAHIKAIVEKVAPG